MSVRENEIPELVREHIGVTLLQHPYTEGDEGVRSTSKTKFVSSIEELIKESGTNVKDAWDEYKKSYVVNGAVKPLKSKRNIYDALMLNARYMAEDRENEAVKSEGESINVLAQNSHFLSTPESLQSSESYDIEMQEPEPVPETYFAPSFTVNESMEIENDQQPSEGSNVEEQVEHQSAFDFLRKYAE